MTAHQTDHECAVCYGIPEGEVHQCNNGHCYCVACWSRLAPRCCPECRLPLPDVNRNRAAERAIAALEWSCAHCDLVTTRGAMAAHRRVCPRAPSDAALAAMGLAEAVAALRAHLPVVRVAETACLRLQDLCEPLGSEQAAAEAGVIEAAVAALQAHPLEVCVQLAACELMTSIICFGFDDEAGQVRSEAGLARAERAAEAGAIEAVLAAMREHPHVAAVQEIGCIALVELCRSASHLAQRAVDAGGRWVVVAAMQAHPNDAEVQCCLWAAGTELLGGTDAQPEVPTPSRGPRRRLARGRAAVRVLARSLRSSYVKGAISAASAFALAAALHTPQLA